MDKWLRNITVVRIVALTLGVLLWAVVDLDEDITPGTSSAVIKTQEISNVSITKIGLDEGRYVIKSVQPAGVTVKITGRQSALNRVNTNNTQIVLDLSDISKGNHSLRLRESGFPPGVEVDISPMNVMVTIEEKQKKEMPVDIDVIGKPAGGFKAALPIITPGRVHIEAPTSQLDEIEFVRAEINIEGAKETFTAEVKLAAYNKDGDVVKVSITPSIVDVEIPISSPFKAMPLQIRLIGQTPPGYSIASYKQSANEVTVYGPQELLDSMDFYEAFEINLFQLTDDRLFTIDITKSTGIEKLVPNKVEVKIDIVASETKTFEKVGITVSGLNEGTEARIIEPENGSIDLTLEAAPALLEKVKPEDIEAIVDVSNLPVGRHEVPIVLGLPTYVKKASQNNLTVAVEINEKGSRVNEANEADGEPTDTTDPTEENIITE